MDLHTDVSLISLSSIHPDVTLRKFFVVLHTPRLRTTHDVILRLHDNLQGALSPRTYAARAQIISAGCN